MAGYAPDNSLQGACKRGLISMGQAMVLAGVQKGKTWFADSTITTPGGGTSWGNAVSTINDAYDKASAGDTIYISGSFNEALNCTKEGLSIVGVGNSVRQALWTAPTGAGAYCITAGAAYLRLQGIYFKAPAYSVSGVPAAVKLSGASYLNLLGCKFQGQTSSYKGLYSAVADSDNVTIDGCEFNYFNTATNGGAILGVEAGGVCYSGWKILNTKFGSNLKHVDIALRNSLVKGCVFPIGGVIPAGTITAAFTTMCLDISGDQSGANVVTENAFGGEYDTDLYVAGATGDAWYGNYTMIETTDAPYGLTVTDPAAED